MPTLAFPEAIEAMIADRMIHANRSLQAMQRHIESGYLSGASSYLDGAVLAKGTYTFLELAHDRSCDFAIKFYTADIKRVHESHNAGYAASWIAGIKQGMEWLLRLYPEQVSHEALALAMRELLTK